MPDDVLKHGHSFSGLDLQQVLRSENARPSIAIVGLGYVGAVSAACLARMGCLVIGVDVNPDKVSAIQSGRAPLLEAGLPSLVLEGIKSGRLSASADLATAVAASDITFISVGTPSLASGAADLSALKSVAHAIGEALARKGADYHLVTVRSTVPATTTRNIILPILEASSGLRCGESFGLCFQPEFLREGVAIEDFFDPPKTVIGGIDARSMETLAAVYEQIEAPLIRTSLEAAEMVKQVDNAWHALKIAFANEVGRLSQSLQADSHEIMSIFCRDTKLNISQTYLRPGFAFGGSCLPKDLRAICNIAQQNRIELPLMRSILASNDAQIGHALELVRKTRLRRIAWLGATFKPDTDDLRESPHLDLIGRVLSSPEIAEVRVFDPNVTAEGLRLARAHSHASSHAMDLALRLLPSLLMDDVEELLDWASIVIVAHGTLETAEALRRCTKPKVVLDLALLPQDLRAEPGYQGVCW